MKESMQEKNINDLIKVDFQTQTMIGLINVGMQIKNIKSLPNVYFHIMLH